MMSDKLLVGKCSQQDSGQIITNQLELVLLNNTLYMEYINTAFSKSIFL